MAESSDDRISEYREKNQVPLPTHCVFGLPGIHGLDDCNMRQFFLRIKAQWAETAGNKQQGIHAAPIKFKLPSALDSASENVGTLICNWEPRSDWQIHRFGAYGHSQSEKCGRLRLGRAHMEGNDGVRQREVTRRMPGITGTSTVHKPRHTGILKRTRESTESTKMRAFSIPHFAVLFIVSMLAAIPMANAAPSCVLPLPGPDAESGTESGIISK